MRLYRLALLCFIGITALGTDYSTAGDWPQILGPNRDGIARSEKIASSWPAGGPTTVILDLKL